MLLITEHTEDTIECITEANTNNICIEGVYMQAELENKNKRIYPKSVLEIAVDAYNTEYVLAGRAGGELNHPSSPVVNPERISHRITELRWDGNNVIGKALVLDTPMGQIVKGLIKGGMKLGVSSRGMGTIENKNGKSYVKDDFRLSTVDVVFDPSAPSAFVNGIMEGVEFFYDNGILKSQQLETYKTEIVKAPSKRLAEVQEKIFTHFLSSLKTKNI